DHHRRSGAAGATHRIEDVADQRAPADRVQHLGTRRTHAGAFAGREHDGEAAALTRQDVPPPSNLPSSGKPGWRLCAGAVISESSAVEKAGMPAPALANKAT